MFNKQIKERLELLEEGELNDLKSMLKIQNHSLEVEKKLELLMDYIGLYFYGDDEDLEIRNYESEYCDCCGEEVFEDLKKKTKNK